MKTILFNLIMVFLIVINCFGQETYETGVADKEKRVFQFSFIYPMGTNGVNSKNYSNLVSLNLLGGMNGGVDAFELGGFVNINNGNVKGFQGAGFTNINIGNSKSFQIAGFYNQNNEFDGCQFAGFLNNNLNGSSGLIAAGFGNVSKGISQGWQMAGFFNTSAGEMHGAQFAGFANVSGNMKGCQISGFANVARDFNGVQLGGFVNVARKVKGVQLGFINVADSVNGVSIGFLNFIKNGYNRIEIGASESLYANISFKLGSDRFYNIFTGGFKQTRNNTYLSYGYGIGTVLGKTKYMDFNIDAICQQINENTWETYKLNLLNTVKFNVSMKFAKHLELAAGPSFNVFVSEFDFTETIGTSSSFVPYCFYDQVYQNYSIKMFAGFNAALRF